MNLSYVSFLRKPSFALNPPTKAWSSPGRLHSLLWDFTVCCQVAILNFKPLPSLCSCTGQNKSYMVGAAKYRFSLDTAYISLLISFVIHDCQKLTKFCIF